jgi:hypothetical protein
MGRPRTTAPKGRRVVAGLAVIGALGGATPADALAAKARGDRICAPRATLYEAPSGIPIGVVTGGSSVLVLKRTANKRWTRVRTAITARGWVRTSTLCGED